MSSDLSGAELRAMWDFDHPERSESVLRAAADGSAAAPARQAELLTQVARAMGLQGRCDEAHHVLDALAPTTEPLAVRVLLERGRLHRSAGDAPPAVSCFEAAVVAAEHAGLDALQVDALHMLAITDDERTQAWTARGLAVAESSADPEARRWSVALHNNLGWTLMDLGRPADALVEFERAHAAALEVGSPEQEQIGRWAVARCLRELGRVPEALAIQRRLAEERPEDPYVFEEIEALERALGRVD